MYTCAGACVCSNYYAGAVMSFVHAIIFFVPKFRMYAKFVSSAEKLHKCHNDYTLAILNANTHLNHHHKSTVPFCLNILQERMELTVSQW